MENKSVVVYTIGHSNFEIDFLISLLNKYNIEKVFDIRSVPYSKYNPQYNRERLRASLIENNIDYIFAGERLGGRIKDSQCYLNNQLPTRKGNIAELINFDVLKNKDWFRAGINQVILSAQKQNVAILCSEENPDLCHRKLLVSRRLQELEVSVYHIRKDGLFHDDNGEQIVQLSFL